MRAWFTSSSNSDRWSTPARVGIGFLFSIGSELVILRATGGDLGADDWLLALPWFVVAAFALAMRYRARAIEGRYERVRLEERTSLARELHDTVAHHVSAIAVQAQAAQFIGQTDPEANPHWWAKWVPKVAQWLDEGRSPTVFLHTPDNDVAPELARRFHGEVAALVDDLASLPEPIQPASQQTLL